MALHRLIYISSGTRKFDADELRQILDTAVKNNVTIDVTGMLLYLDGNFLQLLEGSREDVEGLYERIALDQRHSGAMVLSRSEVSERLFPEWAMGFKSVDPEKDSDMAGAFKLGHETIAEKMTGVDDALAKKMVETFMEVNT
ncbi:MAG: hypothetical protein ACI9JL_003946 [Paracoccaceae bacterium]|jgi:hypothetical protein